MTIDQQIDDLLNQIDSFMQELIKNKVPCDKLIEQVLIRMGEHHKYLTDIYIDVYVAPSHYWIGLRRTGKPIALDGKDTTKCSQVTIEIDNQYWWTASYAKQLIIVHSLPKLLEKALEHIKQNCVIAPTQITFDQPQPAKSKRPWWTFWRKR